MRGQHIRFQWLAAGAAFLVLVLLASMEGASAMGKLCVFSAVKGVVLSQDKPVRDAKVVRTFNWTWGKETASDEAITDLNGEFRLPAIFRSSLLGSLLPHQPVIGQTIVISHGDREYKAWVSDKWDYEEHSETGGKPFDLICRLENEPSRKGDVSGFFGICELRGETNLVGKGQ